MTNYKLIKSEFIPMGKVKEFLKGMSVKDMTMGQKYVREHVSKNTKLTSKKAESLIKELEALEIHKLKPYYVVKIADALPEDKEALRVLVEYSKIAFDEEDLEKIMQIVNKYN